MGQVQVVGINEINSKLNAVNVCYELHSRWSDSINAPEFIVDDCVS